MGDILPAATAATLERLYADDARQRAAGLPVAQRTRNIDRASGRFLALTVVATGAREIVEMGSSNGVSTIWLASGALRTGGRVTGSELIPERAEAANANLAEAGLGLIASVLPGDARAIVAELGRPIDLLFIDAEKDDYPAHLLAAVDLVRPGGLILADNAVSHDLSAYQELVRGRADLATATLPIGRGLEYTIRLG